MQLAFRDQLVPRIRKIQGSRVRYPMSCSHPRKTSLAGTIRAVNPIATRTELMLFIGMSAYSCSRGWVSAGTRTCTLFSIWQSLMMKLDLHMPHGQQRGLRQLVMHSTVILPRFSVFSGLGVLRQPQGTYINQALSIIDPSAISDSGGGSCSWVSGPGAIAGCKFLESPKAVQGLLWFYPPWDLVPMVSSSSN